MAATKNTKLLSLDAITGAENKVKAATKIGGGTAGSVMVLVYFLNKWSWISDMDSGLKLTLATALAAALTATGTFVAGFLAQHSHRPDLAPASAGDVG